MELHGNHVSGLHHLPPESVGRGGITLLHSFQILCSWSFPFSRARNKLNLAPLCVQSKVMHLRVRAASHQYSFADDDREDLGELRNEYRGSRLNIPDAGSSEGTGAEITRATVRIRFS